MPRSDHHSSDDHRVGVVAWKRLDDQVSSVYERVIAAGAGAPTRIDDLRSAVRSVDPLLNEDDVTDVAGAVVARLHGLGPLEAVLGDPEVTEVMVNGPGPVWVERAGQVAPVDLILDRRQIELVIERIVSPLGLRADRTSPMVDARLPDGSRVNAVLPPLAIDGPYLTIRRFVGDGFHLSDFAPREVVDLLGWAVSARLNMVVSGGTGAGKTSLLNALASRISDGERVVTVEDAAELQLPGAHIVRLEARPANAEGVGQVGVRTLVRNALRMRPDRIIVGEVRGAEAIDMVQAMNTGHEGSLSTCHANSPIDAVRRLETMVLMSELDLPLAAVREHLCAAIDLIVQVERGTDGVRRINGVATLSLGNAGDADVAVIAGRSTVNKGVRVAGRSDIAEFVT